MIGFITSLLIQVLGVLVQVGWPVLGTYEYLKKGEHKVQWLTYWTLYFALYSIESLFDAIIGCSGYLPYTVLKSALCLWLVHPTYLGASWLYVVFLEKLFQVVDSKVGHLIRDRIGTAEESK